MITWFRNAPTRTKVLVILGIVLVVLALTGRLTSRSDVDIDSDEAIEIARPEVTGFEPEIEEAKLIRQGFGRRPVWVVAFAIQDPEGGRDDFIWRTTVEVDAGDGEIIDVNIENAPAADTG